MAKKSPVSLKDLIERQRELAAAGDANAAKQLTRLEDLAKETKAQTAILQDIRSSQPAPRLAIETQKILKQDRILQVVQTLEARKADKDDDRIAAATESLDEIARKGLIDKTGDGLNANVLNLLKVMSKFTSGVVPPAGINPPETRRESAPERIPESQRGKQGATGYAKQQIKLQTLDRVASQGEKGRLGAIGYAKQEFKKLGTLSGWFNTSSEKGQGLLGQAVMRQEAKNDFVKEQLATGATTNKDLAGKRFDKVNELRLQAEEHVNEVIGMHDRGLSEDQIERTGTIKKMQAVDEKLAIANPLYREIRAAETNAVVPVRGNVKPAESNTSAPNNSPLPELSVPGLAAPVSPVSPAEQSAENLRLMVDQTESIKQIALNTQPIGDILKFLQGSKPKQDTQSAGGNEDQGDGLLDKFPGKGLLRKGGQLLRRAGKGIVSAGRAIATGAAPLLSKAGGLAGRAIAGAGGAGGIVAAAAPIAAVYGAANVVDYGLGKLGVGKDADGNDLQVNKEQDDANWKKMSWSQKLQSGVARGIEKVGGFVGLGNVAQEAAASRVKSETEYFAKKEAGEAAPAKEAGPNWKAALKDYEESTPVDHLEKQFPGIKKTFVEMASKSVPRSDSKMSIENHEQMLKTRAMAKMSGKGGETKPAENDNVKTMQAERDAFAEKGPATDSAQSQKAYEKVLAAKDRAIAAEKQKSGLAPSRLARSDQMQKEKEGIDQEVRARSGEMGPEVQKEQLALEKWREDNNSRAVGDIPPKPVVNYSPAKANPVATSESSKFNTGYKPAVVPNIDVSIPEPRSADAVYNKSGENAAIAQQAAAPAPVVINAPSTSSVQQTQNYAPMSPPRNTESSLQQYNRSRFAF